MDPKDDIKRRLKVSEVVGEYVPLKPAGNTGSFKTVCPFHQEKTPSFYVSDEKEIWHCFGCDAGGDIFSFVMDIEGVEFPEALRILARKAGVEIPRFNSARSNERQRLMTMHDLAVKYYKKVLTDSNAAASARAYLENRGIDHDLAEKFGLGFAPDDWNKLSDFLISRGYTAQEVIKGGLAQRKKSGTGIIDKFRNRIMVPLRDHHGNVVGFTGRILGVMTEKSGPKYMNSPETPIYQKSDLLYGLDLAKGAIKQKNSVIIVEGNLDVIASHKAGIENVVASSGTALTERQIESLLRYTNQLIFCFDADAAGFAAAKRGIRLAQGQGGEVMVVILNDAEAKDPDDLIQKDPELWTTAVNQPISIMDYYFRQTTKGKKMSAVKEKKEVGKFLLTEIAYLKDKIEREYWLQQLSDLLRMDINVLRNALPQIHEVHQEQRRETAAMAKKTSKTPFEQTLGIILALFMVSDELREGIISTLEPNELPENDYTKLYKTLILEYNSDKSQFAEKSFFAQLRHKLAADEEQSHIAKLLDEISMTGEKMLEDYAPNELRTQLNAYLDAMHQTLRKAKRKDLEAAIRLAESQGEAEKVKQLIEKLNSLMPKKD